MSDAADPKGQPGSTMGGPAMNNGMRGIGQGIKDIVTGIPNTTMTGPMQSGCSEGDFVGQAVQQTIISNGTK